MEDERTDGWPGDPNGSPGANVPYARGFVSRDGDQAFAVGREKHLLDRAGVAFQVQLQPGLLGVDLSFGGHQNDGTLADRELHDRYRSPCVNRLAQKVFPGVADRLGRKLPLRLFTEAN